MTTTHVLITLLSSLLVITAHAEDVDLEVIHRIKSEAFRNSQVTDFAFQLTDLNGSRLSGPPGHHRAAKAVAGTMRDIGIADASVVPWGKFGRSWHTQAGRSRTPHRDVPVSRRPWMAGSDHLLNQPAPVGLAAGIGRRFVDAD